MNLKEWLETNKISAYQFSRDTGYSQSLVSMIMSGQRLASADFRLRVLELYGYDEYKCIFVEDYIIKIFEMVQEYLSRKEDNDAT